MMHHTHQIQTHAIPMTMRREFNLLVPICSASLVLYIQRLIIFLKFLIKKKPFYQEKEERYMEYCDEGRTNSKRDELQKI
jgi:hypothetical protein